MCVKSTRKAVNCAVESVVLEVQLVQLAFHQEQVCTCE